jgi:hypothetical protein
MTTTNSVVGLPTLAGINEANGAAIAGLHVELSHIAIGSGGWTPTPLATELLGEFLRIPISSYEIIGDGIKRITAIVTPAQEEPYQFDGDVLYLYPSNMESKISSVIITSADGLTTYTGADYTVDPIRCEIARKPTGAITPGETVRIVRSDYGVEQPIVAASFNANRIQLPTAIPTGIGVVVSSQGSSTIYTEGVDYTYDQRVAKVTRLNAGTIAVDAPVNVSFQRSAAIREIGAITTTGVLFSIVSSPDLLALTNLSALSRGQYLSFNQHLVGLPPDSVTVTLSTDSTVSINTVESSLTASLIEQIKQSGRLTSLETKIQYS